MAIKRYTQASATEGIDWSKASIVINPKNLDDLFKFAVVAERVQHLLEQLPIAQVNIYLPAKSVLYDFPGLSVQNRISVRLPRSEEELKQMEALASYEVWEDDSVSYGILSFEEHKPVIKKQHADIAVLQRIWTNTSEKKKKFGILSHFPLFRDRFFSVYWKSKKDAVDLLLERLRQRYVAHRNIESVPSAVVVTPNLDHMRMLFGEKNRNLQEVYERAILQTPDGYPPLVRFSRESIGYKTTETITGVDLFMQLINTIGREALPYTIYFVGGFGNVPYQARDYFIRIYPNLSENFVGISTPPRGFLDNKEMLDAIAADIEKKKPDLIFAGMTAPVQERFIFELMKRKVNFGIGFGVGRSIEIVTGYQKKEPAIIEKLHLGWIYRPLFDPQGARFRKRVYEDFVFVFRELFRR